MHRHTHLHELLRRRFVSSLLHILPVAPLREGVLREDPGGPPGVLAGIGEVRPTSAGTAESRLFGVGLVERRLGLQKCSVRFRSLQKGMVHPDSL